MFDILRDLILILSLRDLFKSLFDDFPEANVLNWSFCINRPLDSSASCRLRHCTNSGSNLRLRGPAGVDSERGWRGRRDSPGLRGLYAGSSRSGDSADWPAGVAVLRGMDGTAAG